MISLLKSTKRERMDFLILSNVIYGWFAVDFATEANFIDSAIFVIIQHPG
jgi:hypothetical protein